MARLKGAKRQNSQLKPAFEEGTTSEARSQSSEGTEASVAKCSAESLAPDEQWMERICQRENLWQAFKRVKGNGGRRPSKAADLHFPRRNPTGSDLGTL